MFPISKEKITLTKYMSRERSLFYYCIWCKSNLEDERYSNKIKNIVYFNKGTGKTGVYYDLQELEKDFADTAKRLQNPEHVEHIFADYTERWKILFEYVQRKRRISTITNLKDFYNLFVDWWGSMAALFIIPDIEDIPQSIRQRALNIRKEHEKYSEEGNKIFLEFFTASFLQYASFANVITPEEVFSLEDSDWSEKKRENIKERLSGYILINGEIFSLIYLSVALQQYKLELREAEVHNTHDIKGMSACNGFVQGRVRIIETKSDLAKLKKGEILVASMTHPEYISFLSKAVAIVTDEGGVVCHAAIVSRELNIPCIVGTKVATRILRTGDCVEVNATTGVIRKL